MTAAQAKRLSWTPDDIEVESPAVKLSLVSDQVIDLNWHDAWRHELRGPHGEWVRSGEALVSRVANAKSQMNKIKSDAENSFDFGTSGLVDAAIDSYGKGDVKKAANTLRMAAGGMGVADDIKQRLTSLADTIDPQVNSAPGTVSPEAKAVNKFLVDNAGSVPGMFGSNTALAWDKEVPTEYPQYTDPGTLASVDWKGHMSISDAVANKINEILSGKGSIDNPDSLIVPLHELVHVTLPKGSFTPGKERTADAEAYKDPAVQAIEEGFTQLGTTQHAAEFFRNSGIGDRETPFLAQDANGHLIPDPSYKGLPGTSDAKHATLAEYADRLNDPARIQKGDAWPTYAAWTRDAYNFVNTLSQLAGSDDPQDAQRMSDAINAVGAASKLRRMAELTMVAAGLDRTDPPLSPQEREAALVDMEGTIRSSWKTADPKQIVGQASNSFRSRIQTMRMQEAAA